MNKREMLGRLLKKGVLLTPDEFGNLTPKNYTSFIEKRGRETGTAEGKSEAYKKESPINAVKSQVKLSSLDAVNAHKNGFIFLSGVLAKKLDAVSIDKAKKVFSEVSVIGRVKSKSGSGFVLEDVTGEAEVIFDDKNVEEGDVIGLKGFFRGNNFLPSVLIWPDMPLQNPNPRVEGKLILSGSSKDNGNVLIPCERKGEVWMKTHEGIPILCYRPENKIDESGAVKILRGRVINGQKMSPFFLKEVPKIFWIPGNIKNWAKNYKGIIIISTEEKSRAVCSEEEVYFE